MPDRADQSSEPQLRGYPDWLAERESIDLQRRRSQLTAPHAVSPDAPRVGLALSGGGIRSATFSLGLVQALARSGVLPRIDYLSTVSGGGYIGSFLGALYARGARVEEVLQTLTQFPESHPLRWLRSNGRFLAPNGAGASWLAGAVLLRNWLSLLFVLAPVAFCLAFLSVFARTALGQLLTVVGLDASLDQLHLGAVAASPLLVAPALCALYWMLPCWLAYWMVNAGQLNSRSSAVTAVSAMGVLLLPLALAYLYPDPTGVIVLLVVGFVSATALVFFLAGGRRWSVQRRAGTRARRGEHRADEVAFNPFAADRDYIARNHLSEWLKSGFMAVVFTMAIALIDALSCWLFGKLQADGLAATLQKLAALVSAVGGAVLATHRILAQLGPGQKHASSSRVPVGALVAVSALILFVLGGIIFTTAAYWIAADGSQNPASHRAALGIVSSFVALVVLGRFQVFVNQSSLGPLYNARLTRAYVGASNPNRWSPESKLKGKESPIEPIPGDQLDWDQYKPHEQGGPIHLINVTVNETVDAQVQLHQPDRKGMIMAVGPVGVSLGVRHHAAWDGKMPEPDKSTFHVFPTGKELEHAEKLPLGHWVAVSGAAVAPGLGQLSLTGASLLLGILNMRLGYWWFSNASVKERQHQAQAVSLSRSLMSVLGHLFPVYRLLAAEFLDRFPGTAIPYWYLSDGGHLENTGCYELIRRRVPFILCIDNGADPQAECSDLANLVRLARVDFGAEIEFLDREQLDTLLDPAVACYFGELQELKRSGSVPTVYAGLARVRYTGGAAQQGVSWLLVVKPRVLGTEALDVTAYGLSNSTFPQQSTADQNFDDTQWEAYRKLGDSIGSLLFDTRGERAADHWSPRCLDQQALELLNRQHPPDSAVRRRRGRSGVPGREGSDSGVPAAGAS